MKPGLWSMELPAWDFLPGGIYIPAGCTETAMGLGRRWGWDFGIGFGSIDAQSHCFWGLWFCFCVVPLLALSQSHCLVSVIPAELKGEWGFSRYTPALRQLKQNSDGQDRSQGILSNLSRQQLRKERTAGHFQEAVSAPKGGLCLRNRIQRGYVI